jgi:hypothetical protein
MTARAGEEEEDLTATAAASVATGVDDRPSAVPTPRSDKFAAAAVAVPLVGAVVADTAKRSGDSTVTVPPLVTLLRDAPP